MSQYYSFSTLKFVLIILKVFKLEAGEVLTPKFNTYDYVEMQVDGNPAVLRRTLSHLLH
jgi:hypothetical protein